MSEALFVFLRTPRSVHDDVEGVRYGFHEQVTSHRLVTQPGAGRFVYYNTDKWRGGEPRQAFVGTGLVRHVTARSPDEAGRKRWFAHIDGYMRFPIPVARERGGLVSTTGRPWNHQHGIASVEPNGFRAVVAAGLGVAPGMVDSVMFDGPTLDRLVESKARAEQASLRRFLLRGQGAGACAFCSAVLPEDLLVAAHIKKRSECSEAERRDLGRVAVLACKLGCDSLYENGYIAVSEDGTVIAARVDAGSLAKALSIISGRRCQAFTRENASYFAWHRQKTFRG